ncbi:hypothetical protein PsorP6_002385 [Peronosclerospora sorghi]|uniref:Uncharacterized protein n=1 Tax=Peronosclerospora sorghi TaxID=230839 RepID=A0ACC0WTC0_9STRA|nr:hypothetical protein PsorP6_002385 [Peronosclerospora sorghi]
MALRVFYPRALRFSCAAFRSPISASSANSFSSRCSGAGTFVCQFQTRSFAKNRKSKGSSVMVSNDNIFDQDEENGGAAEALEKAKKNMNGAVINFTRVLSQIRPGRADAGIFDMVHVQAYGQHVPLTQVAQVSVVGTHALSVTVYDPSETRAELLKTIKKQAEQARQHVRRVRQDAMNHAKKLKETVTEDAAERQKERIQKVTDDAITEIAKLLEAKGRDLTLSE